MLVFIKKKNEKGINSLCSDIKENHHSPLNAPLFCYITLQRGAPLSHNIKRPQDTKKLHACNYASAHPLSPQRANLTLLSFKIGSLVLLLIQITTPSPL